MLHCFAGDGWSFANYVYRRIMDSSRTSRRFGRSTPRWFYAWMNNENRHFGQPASPLSTHNVPKGKLGHIRLESWGHIRNWSVNPGPQVKHIALILSRPAEKVSVLTGARQSYNWRGLEVTGSRFHMRSLLLRLAGKCDNGQESQWKVEDVRRFHGPK